MPATTLTTTAKADRNGQQPEGKGEEIQAAGNAVPVGIDRGGGLHAPRHQPAQRNARQAAQEADDAGLGEKEHEEIAVGGPDRLAESDLLVTLQHRHQQGVHDAQRGDPQGDAADGRQQQLDRQEEPPHVLELAEDGPRVVAHAADLLFHVVQIGRIADPHGNAGIARGQGRPLN